MLTADDSGMTAGIAKATEALNDFGYSSDSASIAMMRQMDTIDAYNNVLMHSTSIMGQSISNLQEFGLATDEQYEKFRRFQIGLELVLVPLEIYMMYQQFAQARTMATTGAMYGQVAATNTATASTWRLNAAMSANPVVLIIIAVLALVTALYVLEKKFGFVTTQVAALNNIFQAWADAIRQIIDGIEGLAAKADIFGDIGDRVGGYVGSVT